MSADSTPPRRSRSQSYEARRRHVVEVRDRQFEPRLPPLADRVLCRIRHSHARQLVDGSKVSKVRPRLQEVSCGEIFGTIGPRSAGPVR